MMTSANESRPAPLRSNLVSGSKTCHYCGKSFESVKQACGHLAHCKKVKEARDSSNSAAVVGSEDFKVQLKKVSVDLRRLSESEIETAIAARDVLGIEDGVNLNEDTEDRRAVDNTDKESHISDNADKDSGISGGAAEDESDGDGEVAFRVTPDLTPRSTGSDTSTSVGSKPRENNLAKERKRNLSKSFSAAETTSAESKDSPIPAKKAKGSEKRPTSGPRSRSRQGSLAPTPKNRERSASPMKKVELSPCKIVVKDFYGEKAGPKKSDKKGYGSILPFLSRRSKSPEKNLKCSKK